MSITIKFRLDSELNFNKISLFRIVNFLLWFINYNHFYRSDNATLKKYLFNYFNSCEKAKVHFTLIVLYKTKKYTVFLLRDHLHLR